LGRIDREQEIAQLGAAYGSPLRQRYVVEMSPAAFEFWTSKPSKRFGEVVLFILRRNGKLILHTKQFYPERAFRVPSGTIVEHEPLLDAVYRETEEETGLQVSVERFLAALEFELRCGGHMVLIPSYLFLLREREGHLETHDPSEQIAAFSEVDPSDLSTVAERLETLPGDWHDWGVFRAIPHRVAAQLLRPRSWPAHRPRRGERPGVGQE
jgi:ADP-ribose pyrophosphatase YjhB (NUDIX family)